MLSEFRKRKMVHLFKMFDLNDDEYISLEEDFIRYLSSLVEAGYLEAGSEKYDRMRAESIALWNDLREHADQDRDERVNLDEWLAWHNVMDEKVEAGATFPFEQYFSTMFAIMDLDSSGDVSVDEYKLLLKMYGVEMDEAEIKSNFQTFDKNGNGRLSREEVAEINANYWFSDDPEAPDNLLFGKFD